MKTDFFKEKTFEPVNDEKIGDRTISKHNEQKGHFHQKY